MMFEAIEVIAKLFSGKVVKHDGDYFTLESARLYTIPEEPVPIYVATAGPVNAKRTGRYADGIITVGAADEKIARLWEKFREGAEAAGKDASAMRTQLQVHVSWAPTQAEAEQSALTEWPNGGMPFPKQDIKNPEDFAHMAKLVRIEHFANRMLISADLEEHTEALQKYVDMGFDEIYLHNVGRNQPEFIATFGERVLPSLKLS
jgi:G6PDH family F420-dependent oxidoreductase